MTLDLATLEDFQALVDTGNFARAAAARAGDAGLDMGMAIRLVRPATRLDAAGERFWGVIGGG
jgi:hypothetical protein